MSTNISTIKLETSEKEQILDITNQVSGIVSEGKVPSGICYIYVPHTTAAVTVNENADPDVKRDILLGLREMVPEQVGYMHAEGNSPAHIKASLIGPSSEVFIENGKMLLGTWQGIYFCEFDGPRTRKVNIKIIKG